VMKEREKTILDYLEKLRSAINPKNLRRYVEAFRKYISPIFDTFLISYSNCPKFVVVGNFKCFHYSHSLQPQGYDRPAGEELES